MSADMSTYTRDAHVHRDVHAGRCPCHQRFQCRQRYQRRQKCQFPQTDVYAGRDVHTARNVNTGRTTKQEDQCRIPGFLCEIFLFLPVCPQFLPFSYLIYILYSCSCASAVHISTSTRSPLCSNFPQTGDFKNIHKKLQYHPTAKVILDNHQRTIYPRKSLKAPPAKLSRNC